MVRTTKTLKKDLFTRIIFRRNLSLSSRVNLVHLHIPTLNPMSLVFTIFPSLGCRISFRQSASNYLVIFSIHPCDMHDAAEHQTGWQLVCCNIYLIIFNINYAWYFKNLLTFTSTCTCVLVCIVKCPNKNVVCWADRILKFDPSTNIILLVGANAHKKSGVEAVSWQEIDVFMQLMRLVSCS